MATSPYFDPDTTANCIQMVQYTRYGTLATTTLLAWDILTTLDQEIRHIWRLRMCFSKCQFLIMRYGTLALFLYQSLMIISPTPNTTCRGLGWFNAAISSAIMIILSFALIVRTWAVYDRRQSVLWVLISTYGAVFAPAIVILARPPAEYFAAMKDFEAVKDATKHDNDVAWLLGGCYVSGWSDGFVALFVSLLVYETGLFIATAYKLWSARSSATLIGNLFRDGTVYYIAMLGALVGGAVGSSSLASIRSRAFVASGYFVGLKVVACSHMFLQLRSYLMTSEAYIEGVLQPADDDLSFDEIHTEVRFADPRVFEEKNEDNEDVESRRGSFEWDGKANWARSDEESGQQDGVGRTSASSDPGPLPFVYPPSPTYPPPTATSPTRRMSRTSSTKRSMGSIKVTRFGIWEESDLLPPEDEEVYDGLVTPPPRASSSLV